MNIRKLWTELFQKPAGRLILFLLAGALVFGFLFSGKGHRSTADINPAVPAQATTAKGYSFIDELPSPAGTTEHGRGVSNPGISGA